MAVVPGDVMLVTFFGNLAGSTVLNTFHYAASTVVGAPTPAAYAAEVLAKLQTVNNLRDRFLGCCPPAYTMNELWVQFISSSRFRKLVGTINLPGTFAQDANTANLAGVITRTGSAARKDNIGSIHVPYPNLDPGVSGGITSAAWQAEAVLLAAVVDDVQTLATLGDITPVLFKGPPNTNAVPITDAFVQATLRVMRRRTKGLGI